jgi:hypothetical protein
MCILRTFRVRKRRNAVYFQLSLSAHSVQSFSKAFQLHSGSSCLLFLFLAQQNCNQTFVGAYAPASPLHATQKTHAMRKLSIALLIAILSPTCFRMPLVLPGDDILPFPHDGNNAGFGISPDVRLCHTGTEQTITLIR